MVTPYTRSMHFRRDDDVNISLVLAIHKIGSIDKLVRSGRMDRTSQANDSVIADR